MTTPTETPPAPAPDFADALGAVLEALDIPEGLTPAARRKLSDARLTAIATLIDHPDTYRKAAADVLAHDTHRLRLHTERTKVRIADADLAKQAAKKAAETLDLDDYLTIEQAAGLLGMGADAVAAMVADQVLHTAYMGTLLHRAEVEQLAEERDVAEELAAEMPEVPATDVMTAEEEAALVDVIESATAADFVDAARPELHDTHAIGDDLAELDDNPGAACYHAFLDLNPQRTEVFTDLTGQAFVVAEGDTGPHLFSLVTGSRFQFAAVTSIGPLTRARIVPADAIVLDRPTTETDDGLLMIVTDAESPPAALTVEAHGDVVLVETTDFDGMATSEQFAPDQARLFAALIALAADEAERGQQ